MSEKLDITLVVAVFLLFFIIIISPVNIAQGEEGSKESVPCPANFNPDSPKWTMQYLLESDYYIIRIFFYQPDPIKRLARIFSLDDCEGRVSSIEHDDGHKERVVKMFNNPQDPKAYLRMPDGSWKQGARIKDVVTYSDTLDPVRHFTLYGPDGSVLAKRTIPLPAARELRLDIVKD